MKKKNATGNPQKHGRLQEKQGLKKRGWLLKKLLETVGDTDGSSPSGSYGFRGDKNNKSVPAPVTKISGCRILVFGKRNR